MASSSGQLGIVLTGGGARGAYQAGALKAIYTICQEQGLLDPFPVLAGNSAGAINASLLASYSHDLESGIAQMQRLWENLQPEDVYRTDLASFTQIGSRWIRELLSGSLIKKKHSTAFLNTTPLLEMLQREISTENILRNIKQKRLRGLALTAFNYSTGTSETFFAGDQTIQSWQRTKRLGIRADISTRHIMASASIPLLFPPVEMNSCSYGDGSIRNYTPLSPAIKLGADRLLVIGVRKKGGELIERHRATTNAARIISILLNAVLMDAIDLDAERLHHLNEVHGMLASNGGMPLKKVELLMLQPSQDIGKIAREEGKHLPKLLRYMLQGLGTQEETSDLMSYLFFDPVFTRRLFRLGYEDALRDADRIRTLINT